MKRLVPIVLLVLLSGSTCFAWNYEGHMTLVAIAYNKLDDVERGKIDVVLQSHPAYTRWQTDHQALAANPAVPFPFYAFLRAANWPDDVRGVPMYHRGTWHYVNFPLKPPNTLNTNVNIGGDLLTQIERNLARVNSQPTTDAKKIQRAISLSWILHLIGDLHQPLHTGALKNTRYPQGDRGGNFFFVRPTSNSQVFALHSVWDGLLGRSREVNVAIAGANMITIRFPESTLATEMTGNYRAWAVDSARLALDSGYQFISADGVRVSLQGSQREGQGPVLPTGYETAARQVAWKQVALGGYRLGNMLKESF